MQDGDSRGARMIGFEIARIESTFNYLNHALLDLDQTEMECRKVDDRRLLLACLGLEIGHLQ